MSILTSPRIHFVGTMSWDPGLANNNPNVFDSKTAEVRLPPGQTNATFPEYLINNLVQFQIWNLYGTHDAKFETNLPNPAENTRVVSGRTSATASLIASDPLLGKPLRLRGKLVDLDPAAVWNSQIFFDEFQLGDATIGLTARRYQTMHSRWINFRRNLDRLDVAGSAGVVWQTVFPRDHIQFVGLDQSPLLNALKRASEVVNAEGIMLRFATYRTLYFQNGLMNSQANRPRDIVELQRLHAEGKFFTNPAYSKLVGTIGVWHANEPTSWLGGRYLVPSNALPSLAVGGTPILLGPAVAEIDLSTNRLVLDFIHTIPEMNRSLDKPNLGDLHVAVRRGQELSFLAKIGPDAYGRAAYEREAGIISLPIALSAKQQELLDSGNLVVVSTATGQPVVVLEEEPLVAVAEKRDHYVNARQSTSIAVRAYERGQPPRQPMKVVATRYLGLQQTGDQAIEAPVAKGGLAKFELPGSEPGAADFAMRLVPADGTNSQLPPQIDITAGQFFSVRAIATDEELEKETSDAELTWEFIYDRVLRNWDLVNPIMTLRGLPLNDEQTLRAVKDRILEVISLAAHESPTYMPITRDLSVGKRRLLERWLAQP